jgi:hypothetical protein
MQVPKAGELVGLTYLTHIDAATHNPHLAPNHREPHSFNYQWKDIDIQSEAIDSPWNAQAKAGTAQCSPPSSTSALGC